MGLSMNQSGTFFNVLRDAYGERSGPDFEPHPIRNNDISINME